MELIYSVWQVKPAELVPRFWSASDLIRDHVHAQFGHGSISAIRRTVQETALLCLDDVGVHATRGPETDAYLDLLTWRRGRPMIATGNLAPAALATVLDDRIVSRICSGVIIACEGPDRRLSDAITIHA